MKTRINVIVLVVLMACMAASVQADWNVGDPYKMHYPQLPDMSPNGLDIKATAPKILADDFQCTQTGPITDVHIWGSWLNDRLPYDPTGAIDPTAPSFKLSIHLDVPAGPAPGYSHPGQEVWSTYFNPGTYHARLWGPAQEHFYDPNVGQIIGTDTQVWQYNFLIPPAAAFVQQQGTIYWLDVQALMPTPDVMFGWKTSGSPHFLDDAVWGDAPFGAPPTVWEPLVYPPGTPLGGQSMDLAFVITPEPASITLVGLGVLALIRRRR